ncbi:hypothetical protein A2Z22_00855 [Candidatus Woesebacteria bacterium RBG_16_34_12]|uniref:Uncharacterized protein n=1 Tax=Candidatus Woesebacteria bacterium RBG_16_34_12 TaxID=1802480 RepID=A0A1F7X8S4_9BACT|nr:MAG: hypothetical protein A2Z22_00855 [Candidatus Woesebacteria bacterium RBG_16_34_12]
MPKKVIISMSTYGDEVRGGRLSSILTELALEQPTIDLDLSDPDTLLMALPRLVQQASKEAAKLFPEDEIVGKEREVK